MFDMDTRHGAPLGPLGERRDLYTTGTSGRTKLHLDPSCVPDLEPTSRILANLVPRDLCSRCHDKYTHADQTWFTATSEVNRIIDQCNRIITKAGQDNESDLWETRWRLFTWAQQVADPPRRSALAAHREVAAWAKSTALPVVEQAQDVVSAQLGGPLPADWPLRLTAGANVLGADGYTIPEEVFPHPEYPALVPKDWGWGALRHEMGQGGIPRLVRDAIRTALLIGRSHDEIVQAGLDAGLGQLALEEGPMTPLQVNLGADVPPGSFSSVEALLTHVWRDQATAEIHRLVTTLAEAAMSTLAQYAQLPVHAYHFRWEDGYYPRMGDAAIAYLAHSQTPEGDLLVLAPEPVAALSRCESSHGTGVSVKWGPVADGDTPHTFETARRLLEQTNGDEKAAVELARAALL